MKKITIIGGGNVGTLIAANLASKNLYEVSILTSDASKWRNEIKVYDANDKLLRIGVLHAVYDRAEDAFKDADLILSTLPSNIYHEKIGGFLPLIGKDTYFGVTPGMGGKEFPFHIDEYSHIKYFAFQRVPGVARIKDYGSSVYDLGERGRLHYAVKNISQNENDLLKKEFEQIFSIPCVQLDNLLSTTLTPSNPILHTSRLYGLSKLAVKGKFDSNYLFYHDWDNFSSEIILGMDDEVQAICRELSELQLNDVKTLREHYESNDPVALTAKLRSIVSLSTIKSPFKETGDSWEFDISSRYFTEDFDYGLLILKSFSEILNLETPFFDEVLKWYEIISGNIIFIDGKISGEYLLSLPLPQNYGINRKEDLIKFYNHNY